MKHFLYMLLLACSTSVLVSAQNSADFSYSFNGFTVCTTPNISPEPEYHRWTFNGVSQGPSNNCYNFGSYGTYSVSLKVWWEDGSSATTSKYVTVPCPDPSGDFTYQADGWFSMDFNATATNPAQGTNLYYRWDFGDGTYKFGPYAYYTFPGFGSYDVTLKLSNSCGGEETITKTILLEAP